MNVLVCPSCGYDLVRDSHIIINEFSMLSPGGDLYYRGERVQITAAERMIIWSIMKAYPKPITHGSILNRLDSEAEGNVVDVHLTRIRNALRKMGAPIPFEPIRTNGQGRAHIWRPQ